MMEAEFQFAYDLKYNVVFNNQILLQNCFHQ